MSWRAILAQASLALAPLTAASAGVAVWDGQAHYPEGPLWHHGALLFVEYSANGIRQSDGRHSSDYWSRPGCGPSGLIDYGADHLLVACYDSNTLVELDEHANAVRTIAADTGGRAFAGPNDFSSDGHGGVYFSASGTYDVKAPIEGRILHLSADGATLTEVANMIHYPNGLTLSKDGSHLLVAEMLAGRILSFAVEQGGTLGARTVWVRLQDVVAPTPHADAYNGPDGLKLGPDGNYYIAQNGSGRVLVVDERKKLVRAIRIATPYVTNMAFAADAVYITGAFDPWKPPFPGAVYRWTP